MTFGQDVHWRRDAVRKLGATDDAHILDLGAGTAEITLEVLRQYPTSRVAAMDITQEMIKIGSRKTEPFSLQTQWTLASGLSIPFPKETFDAVISAFLLRNVPDPAQCLAEQYRVLKHNGKIVVLETTPPSRSLLSPLIQFHTRVLIPFLGKIIAGNETAYRYLQTSMDEFTSAEEFAAALAEAKFDRIHYERFMFGTIAIHTGIKP